MRQYSGFLSVSLKGLSQWVDWDHWGRRIFVSHKISFLIYGAAYCSTAAAAAAASLQSCPTLCDPQAAAHQAPPSLGLSRQEHRSGLPFPSPVHEREKGKWSRSEWYPTLSDPMNCILPGSSVHGIFQARVLEWGAIAFSGCSTSFH